MNRMDMAWQEFSSFAEAPQLSKTGKFCEAGRALLSERMRVQSAPCGLSRRLFLQKLGVLRNRRNTLLMPHTSVLLQQNFR